MLPNALYLARKDLRQSFRQRETWLWAFVMPILFFYFIGTITGGFSRQATTVERIGLYAPASAGPLVEQLAGHLEGLGYKVDRVDAQRLRAYSRRIALPPDFTESVLAGRKATVSFDRSGGGLGADYDELRVKRAAYTVLADVILAKVNGGRTAPRNLSLSVVPAGKRKTIPSGFQQSVPGTMVMFLMLVMFTSGGITLYHERSQSILLRLASTPMSRGAVVLGKWLARLALGLIQTAFALLAGRVLFKIDWGPHFWAVALILLAYAALAAAGGMILGNLGSTERQIVGLGVILSNVLAMVGGCWWPIEITPIWAQKLSLALPTGWAMDAMHKLVSFGDSPLAALPHFIALALAALAAGYILTRSFRFQ